MSLSLTLPEVQVREEGQRGEHVLTGVLIGLGVRAGITGTE